MAQKKAHEVDSWLASPAASVRIVLIYGPDQGLVSERARSFADGTGLALDDPFSVLKLDASELAADAGRLVDEARTVAMFGGDRLIWIRNAGSDKAFAGAIATLCENPPVDAIILIEAGELNKTSALRRTVEQSAAAMALPCYADNSRAIDGLIDSELTAAGLKIDLEARQLLKSLLGGDRLASRGEIGKLVLYCRGGSIISAADVQASIGDVSALSQDAVIDAVLTGNPGDYDRSYSRFIASGAHPFVLLSAMIRQFQQLQLMRSRVDADGASPASVVASWKPPVFFARRNVVETALARMNAEFVARTLERMQDAVLNTRQKADLAVSISRQILLSACLESARRAR